MSIKDKRQEAKHLLRRRHKLHGDILRRAEHRRAACEERRKLRQAIADKRERDPQTDKREAELTRDIEQLHTEILEIGRVVEKDSARLHALRARRHRVSQRLKRARRRVRRALNRRSGPDAAIRAAAKDDGKHEEPPGSNWGPYVSKITKWLGYSGPVYWCGCATGWWTLRKAGGEYTAKIRRGYAGFIEADARANTNGLRLVGSPVKGGVASLWENEHIVTTTGEISNGMFRCWAGNTSRGDGSLSNGGEVAPRWFPLSDADCFASQDY